MPVGAVACPTADDALTGFRVEYADGSYSIIRRDASGAVFETEYSGDAVYEYEASGGLLETGYREVGSDSVDRFKYTFDTSSLVPPRPWTGMAGEQITIDQTGEEIERLPFSVHTRGTGRYRIGDCEYDAIGVQTYYTNPDEKSLVEFIYLFGLDVPVLVGFGGPGYYDARPPVSISKELP